MYECVLFGLAKFSLGYLVFATIYYLLSGWRYLFSSHLVSFHRRVSSRLQTHTHSSCFFTHYATYYMQYICTMVAVPPTNTKHTGS